MVSDVTFFVLFIVFTHMLMLYTVQK